MSWVRRAANVLILLAATNLVWTSGMMEAEIGFRWDVLSLVWLMAFAFVNLRPLRKDGLAGRSWHLRAGTELLRLFLMTATVNILLTCGYLVYFRSVLFDDVRAGLFFKGIWILTLLNLAGMVLLETVVFWNGTVRIYLASNRLSTRQRVLGILCGWVPLLNIWYLGKIIRAACHEAAEPETGENE